MSAIFENSQNFTFSEENQEKIRKIFNKYPENKKQSGMLPILDIAQRQNNGWLSDSALQAVADIINVPKLSVKSIASFYTMYHLKPVGKNVIEICKTLSCKLRGIDKIQNAIENHLKTKIGETSEDLQFTILPCECLGACVNAPVIKINDDYYEDLSEQNAIDIIDKIKNGSKPKIGSYKDRVSSEPVSENK
jgi:NADH-quinone oxidoreductase E subunit